MKGKICIHPAPGYKGGCYDRGEPIPKIESCWKNNKNICDDGKGEGNWCKSHPGKCEDGGGDDNNNKKHWCDWHKCNDDHHKHDHNHDHHDYTTKNYYYYYTNDYNNNHATVILQPDYSHTNNYHDIRVVIGDSNEFDTVIDFAGKPENFVVTGLDINQGEQFDVCMENQSDGQTNCVTAHLQNENEAVYVDIRVP